MLCMPLPLVLLEKEGFLVGREMQGGGTSRDIMLVLLLLCVCRLCVCACVCVCVNERDAGGVDV